MFFAERPLWRRLHLEFQDNSSLRAFMIFMRMFPCLSWDMYGYVTICDIVHKWPSYRHSLQVKLLNYQTVKWYNGHPHWRLAVPTYLGWKRYNPIQVCCKSETKSYIEVSNSFPFSSLLSFVFSSLLFSSLSLSISLETQGKQWVLWKSGRWMCTINNDKTWTVKSNVDQL